MDTRCLVDKTDWVYDVRLISFSLLFLFILNIINWFVVFWGVLLQSSILEFSLCNLFLGYTTASTSCCFTWYIWEETFSEYMAGFILESFNINCRTFRFVSSLFRPSCLFSLFSFDFCLIFFYSAFVNLQYEMSGFCMIVFIRI